MGFNRSSPKACCDPVGPSLTASRAVEPGAKPALMPRGTGRRAPSGAVAVAFRWKLPRYRYVSSCTARVGAAVRSIASEESFVAPAAQVSFGWNTNIPHNASVTRPIVQKKTYQWMLKSRWFSPAEGQSGSPVQCGHTPF
jgi:hypothetical protein